MESFQPERKTPVQIEPVQGEQSKIEEARFMRSNLKFAIDICDVQQNVKIDIPHAGPLYALAKRRGDLSYLYYLLSGPHISFENITNHE